MSTTPARDSATTPRPEDGPVRDLYDLVTGDENARVCTDISESACREQPANFFIHLVSLFATKAGDLLASPKLVLPWLLASLGAPVWMAGMLVPIRESLALLPQLVVAGWIRQAPVRKWFWVAGSLVQGMMILAMIGAALMFSPAVAGLSILALLAVFSLGRGVCSASYKDVQGKTIAKTRRGTVSGYAASGAGGLAVALGVVLYVLPGARDFAPIVGLLAIAGGLWLIAAGVFACLREFAGATEGAGNALRTALSSLSLIREKPAFGRFIAVRGLLIATALAAPYYAQLARTAGDASIGHLAVLLGLSGLASLVSAPFWGRFSDYSARQVMILTGLAAAVLNAAVALVVVSGLGNWAGVWPFAGAYFVLAGIHAGVRLGRKTYLTDLGSADDRAQLTAVANTTIGIILLAGGGVIAAVGLFGAAAAVAALVLPAAAAAWLACGLPELEARG